jgi:hypothetical protein
MPTRVSADSDTQRDHAGRRSTHRIERSSRWSEPDAVRQRVIEQPASGRERREESGTTGIPQARELARAQRDEVVADEPCLPGVLGALAQRARI